MHNQLNVIIQLLTAIYSPCMIIICKCVCVCVCMKKSEPKNSHKDKNIFNCLSTSSNYIKNRIKRKKNLAEQNIFYFYFFETRSIIFDSFYFSTLFALFTLYYASTSVQYIKIFFDFIFLLKNKK